MQHHMKELVVEELVELVTVLLLVIEVICPALVA
jgi:hypothetical protein